MVDKVCGSKRHFSTTEFNERIALRQMVLNMSICKIHKDQGRKEPSLFRSVVIANTVRVIENEMDEEMLLDDVEFEHDFDSDFAPTDRALKFKTFSIDANNNSINDDSDDLTAEVATKGDDENQYGAIGDKRRKENNSALKKPTNNQANVTTFLWDNLNTNNSSTLDKMDFDSGFPDVDIALYDFDDSIFFPNCPSAPSGSDWRVFPSCASAFERKKPDSYFEELDQMMQILVGM